MYGILDAEIIGITYFTLLLIENDEDDAKFLFFFFKDSSIHFIYHSRFLTILWERYFRNQTKSHFCNEDYYNEIACWNFQF